MGVYNPYGLAPLAADVRSGVGYGFTSLTVSGTAAIPPDFAVDMGVDVDDGVGTGALSTTTVAGITGAQVESLSE